MEKFNNLDKILLKLNDIKAAKKINLEKISQDINKDKTVTSRILNGKYNLDLETFINICYSLGSDPITILDEVINPNIKRIPINKEDENSFNRICKLLSEYMDK